MGVFLWVLFMADTIETLTAEQVAVGVNQLAEKVGQDIKDLRDGKLNAADNAVSASKWAAEITLSFSGSVTGSVSFDGSGNKSAILTLQNSGVVAGTYMSTIKIPSITVNAQGLITGVSMNDIRAAGVGVTGIVALSGDIYSSETEHGLAATIGAVSQVRGLMYGLLSKAGAGINLLTKYIQDFVGVASWAKADVTATVSDGLLKHVRGKRLTIECTNAANPDAYIYFDDTPDTYENIQLVAGVQYIYSFYAMAATAGKKMRCVIRLADGNFAVTTPHPLVLTGTMTRYSISFIANTSGGAVIGFYPNGDGEAGNQFHIEGLMIERVVSQIAGNYNPSEFVS